MLNKLRVDYKSEKSEKLSSSKLLHVHVGMLEMIIITQPPIIAHHVKKNAKKRTGD